MSNQDSAKYRFTSWMRRGIGATMNSHPANGQSRASVQVQLSVVDDKKTPYPTQPSPVAVQLANHGDVTGIAPGLIHITEPLDGTMNFEPNYLCYIEFFGGDFPWMFSPEIPTGAATNPPPGLPSGDRLAPWVVLIV